MATPHYLREKTSPKVFYPFSSLFSHTKFDVIICLNSMISGGGENCGWLIGVGSNAKVISCDCKSLFILQFRSSFFIEKNHGHCPFSRNS